jgi:putative ABC transport system permease protein
MYRPTLKAIGWRSRRIIRQIMGEALVIGLIGGAAGVALGYAGAALVQSLAPPLTATTGASAAGRTSPRSPAGTNAAYGLTCVPSPVPAAA